MPLIGFVHYKTYKYQITLTSQNRTSKTEIKGDNLVCNTTDK